MAKRYNARAIKKNQTYTFEEAAEALGVHEQTVRAWGGRGLRVLRSKTPHLILGDDLRRYLSASEQRRKRPMGPNELFCLKCREPKTPEGNLADFSAAGPGRGLLSGICPDCGRMCQRFVRMDQLAFVAPDLDLNISAHSERLNEPEAAA